jgi:hypothetical protein
MPCDSSTQPEEGRESTLPRHRFAMENHHASRVGHEDGGSAARKAMSKAIGGRKLTRKHPQRGDRILRARSASECIPAGALHSLAGASESTSRTSAIVTPSAQPLVSVATLLELALWCQQRLAPLEGCPPCANAQLDTRLPPVHNAPHSRCATDSPLAGTRAQSPTTPPEPDGADDPAPPPRRRSRRFQGGVR